MARLFWRTLERFLATGVVSLQMNGPVMHVKFQASGLLSVSPIAGRTYDNGIDQTCLDANPESRPWFGAAPLFI